MKLCDIYAALCLVGRLGKDFQTANVLGCTWCGGPSWLLGISFPHQFRHGSNTCGIQLTEGIWGLFRISQAVPYALTEDSWQAIFMFFLMLGVHRELWTQIPWLLSGWTGTNNPCNDNDPIFNCTGGAGPMHQELLSAATATGFHTLPGLNVGTNIAPSCVLSAAGNGYCHLAEERDHVRRSSTVRSAMESCLSMLIFKYHGRLQKIKLSPSKPFRPWN